MSGQKETALSDKTQSGSTPNGVNDTYNSSLTRNGHDVKAQNETLSAALDYLARGWGVIPVQYKDKKPAYNALKQRGYVNGKGIGGWKELEDRLASEDDVIAWFGNSIKLNVAIPMGKVSNIVDLEIDKPELAKPLLEEHGGLPRTFTYESSRGAHYLFRHPGFHFPRQDKIEVMGLEIRGEGNYSVAPPSTHPTGKQYRVIDDTEPAELPEWLLELVKAEVALKKAERQQAASKANGDAPLLIQKELDRLSQIKEGSRNKELNNSALYLGHFIGAGLLDRAEVEQHLTNMAVSVMGLAPSEVANTIKSGLTKGLSEPCLPRVKINNRTDPELAREAYMILVGKQSVKPDTFVRDGKLVKVGYTEPDKHGVRRVRAESIDKDTLKSRLEDVAEFGRFKVIQQDEGEKTVSFQKKRLQPPVVADIMTRTPWPELQPLSHIVSAPTYGPDGRLYTEPGYNPITHCWYEDSGLVIGDINPTPERVKWALSLLLDDLLVDFRWADESSRANVIAAILTPFIRLMVGCVPLFVFDAPIAGTGKGLLCDVAILIFNPKGVMAEDAPNTPDEWRKSVVSILSGAPAHVKLDNLKHKLSSAPLCSVLSSHLYGGRLLGRNDRNVEYENAAVWMVTGNNVEMDSEIARRAVRIRQDANDPRPGSRPASMFKHCPLEKWVLENRNDLVTACLILINKWAAEGFQKGAYTLGSFVEWSQSMDGLLKCIGIDGFMQNAGQVFDEALEAEDDEIQDFLQAWHRAFQDKRVTASELLPLAVGGAIETAPGETKFFGPLLDGLVQGETPEVRARSLGKYLNKRKDTIVDGLKVTIPPKDENSKKATKYKLIEVTTHKNTCADLG